MSRRELYDESDADVATRSREELIYIVRERIASLEPKALLEACQEAEAKYT